MCVAAVGAVACGGGGDLCERIYEAAVKCGDAYGKLPREVALKACKVNSENNPSYFKALDACAKAGDCKAIEACKEKVEIERVRRRIEEAMATKDYTGDGVSCRLLLQQFGPDRELEEACTALLEQAFRDLSQSIPARRSAGEDTGGDCMQLRFIAEDLDRDEVRQAVAAACPR